MSRKPNFDLNVDGQMNERTDGRTEIWTPISHPAISRCDKKKTKLNNQHRSGFTGFTLFVKDQCVLVWSITDLQEVHDFFQFQSVETMVWD